MLAEDVYKRQLLILAVFLIFVVYPLLLILYKSVINPADNSLTLENFTRFFTRKYYVNTLTNSFKAVSYTHLDVYKRQGQVSRANREQRCIRELEEEIRSMRK